MKIIRDFLDHGKGLIGIRTASHAFNANAPVPSPDGAKNSDGSPKLLAQWVKFDEEVLGCKYTGHYPKGPEGTKVTVVPVGQESPHPGGSESG